MKNLTGEEAKKYKETPRVDSNNKPQMCSKSPIKDPISQRDNEYMEVLNLIDNMTNRERKLDSEVGNSVQDTKPKDTFNEAFDEFTKCLKAIDKLSTEEKKMIEANLNKLNSNINESEK